MSFAKIHLVHGSFISKVHPRLHHQRFLNRYKGKDAIGHIWYQSDQLIE